MVYKIISEIAPCLINPDFVSHKSSVGILFLGSRGLNPLLDGEM